MRIAITWVQPVTTSVNDTERANSPFKVGPQWAMVSTSRNPGSASASSPALRIWIEVRSSGPGRVVVNPRSPWVALNPARYRSIVAPDIASSSARTPGLYPPFPAASSPLASRLSRSLVMSAAR